MLNSLHLRQRALLLAYAPALILLVVLGSYFSVSQLNRLHDQLIVQGRILIEHLAPLVSNSLINQQSAQLQQLANRTLEQSDTRAVTIRDAQGRILAHAGPIINNRTTNPDPQHLNVWREFQSSTFVLPIYTSHQLNGETFIQDEKTPLLGWLEVEISHIGVLAEGYKDIMITISIALSFAILVIIGAFWLARSIYVPLQTIKSITPRDPQNPNKTVYPSFACPEFNTLSGRLQRLVDELHSAHEKSQQVADYELQIKELSQNLEEREIQSVELDLARKEAIEGNRIKSEFITNMSHEIRTPLNGILGFTKQLKKTNLNSFQSAYLTTIEQSSNHLLAVINELLDISKIEAGKFMIEPTPLNIRDLIQESLNMLASNAHEKKLELISLFDNKTPPNLFGDELRFRQILNNLIGNAIKFTNQGGHIIVRTLFEKNIYSPSSGALEKVQFQIRVEDNGLGFSPEEKEKLFRPFQQLSRNRGNKFGKGTGLGLAISKKIIEAMHGDIGVEGEYQEGAQFWIRVQLPVNNEKEENSQKVPLALVGYGIPIFDTQKLSRDATINVLEGLKLEGETYDNLQNLVTEVQQAQKSALPYKLVIIGISENKISIREIKETIYKLQSAHCKSILLCPTNDENHYHDILSKTDAKVISKPLLTKTLCQNINDLFPSNETKTKKTKAVLENNPAILCVDDHPINLQLIQQILSDFGANVTIANSGAEALEKTQAMRFEIIFMDIQMPEMDGLETTQHIRRQEQEKGYSTPTPIVALTAHALSSERGHLLNSGMSDYLSKPITEKALLNTLCRFIRQEKPIIPTEEPEAVKLDPTHDSLMKKLRQQLLGRLLSDWELIQKAHQAGDISELTARIHHLSGAVAVCGFTDLHRACKKAETLLKKEQPIAEAIDTLGNLVQALLASLSLDENFA